MTASAGQPAAQPMTASARQPAAKPMTASARHPTAQLDDGERAEAGAAAINELRQDGEGVPTGGPGSAGAGAAAINKRQDGERATPGGSAENRTAATRGARW